MTEGGFFDVEAFVDFVAFDGFVDFMGFEVLVVLVGAKGFVGFDIFMPSEPSSSSRMASDTWFLLENIQLEEQC